MDEEHYHHRRVDVSPLFVGIIGVMAGAMVVAIFHCIVVGWCNSRSQPTAPPIQRRIIRTNNNQQDMPSTITTTSTSRTTSTSTSSSSSNSLLQLMAVYRYSKEFQEGTCVVCLSEFKEDDEVRILPECAHLFHVPCIDMWLYSHSNCPLCRTNTMPPPPLHLSLPQPAIVYLPDSGGVLSSES